MNDIELRKRVRELGMAKVAARAKIPASTLSVWLKETDRDMRSKTKTSLIAAVRAMTTDAPDLVAHAGADFYPVPIFDVRASAGSGAFVEDGEPSGHYMFDRNWLTSVAHGPLPALSVIGVVGDSMENTLRAGDQVLVDRSVRRIVLSGVYVLLFEGELLVKRCERDLGTKEVVMKSDNPRYDTYRLKQTDDFVILGLVIWAGRRMA